MWPLSEYFIEKVEKEHDVEYEIKFPFVHFVLQNVFLLCKSFLLSVTALFFIIYCPNKYINLAFVLLNVKVINIFFIFSLLQLR